MRPEPLVELHGVEMRAAALQEGTGQDPLAGADLQNDILLPYRGAADDILQHPAIHQKVLSVAAQGPKPLRTLPRQTAHRSAGSFLSTVLVPPVMASRRSGATGKKA